MRGKREFEKWRAAVKLRPARRARLAGARAQREGAPADTRWILEDEIASTEHDLATNAPEHPGDRAADRIQAAHAGGRQRLTPAPVIARRPACQTRGRRDRRPAGARPRGRRTRTAPSGGGGDSGPPGGDEPAPGGHPTQHLTRAGGGL